MHVYLIILLGLVSTVLAYQLARSLSRLKKGRLVTWFRECPHCGGIAYGHRDGDHTIWACNQEKVCYMER